MSITLAEPGVIDQAEREELASVIGADPENLKDASQPQLDAIASFHLHRMVELEAERDERQKAMDFELQLIKLRYGRDFDRIHNEHAFRESQVKVIAESADFGKKKSRNVGFGTYGSRVKKGGLRVVDEAAAIAWAELACVSVFRVKVTHNIDKAKLDAYFAESGEEIPGTTVEQDVVEFYAKPEKP